MCNCLFITSTQQTGAQFFSGSIRYNFVHRTLHFRFEFVALSCYLQRSVILRALDLLFVSSDVLASAQEAYCRLKSLLQLIIFSIRFFFLAHGCFFFISSQSLSNLYVSSFLTPSPGHKKKSGKKHTEALRPKLQTPHWTNRLQAMRRFSHDKSSDNANTPKNSLPDDSTKLDPLSTDCTSTDKVNTNVAMIFTNHTLFFVRFIIA